MKDYVILTESTTDLPPELIQKYSINVIPMYFNVGDKEYRNYPDGRDLGFKEFYNYLREGILSQTVQINSAQFTELFEPYIQQGKDLLYIAFSSALSGTCNSAFLAAQELTEKYPDCKIMVVDSLSASMGEGLLVYLAATEKQKGKSIDEVYNWICQNRLHLCHWFTVDDLNHLKRGGRVSATAAMIGTMLGIKPILHVDDSGRLVPVEKVRGRRKALEKLVEKMAQTAEEPQNQDIFISHGDCAEDAEFVAELVRQKFQVKNIYTNYIGPVIGTHSGPGTVALFYLGQKR